VEGRIQSIKISFDRQMDHLSLLFICSCLLITFYWARKRPTAARVTCNIAPDPPMESSEEFYLGKQPKTSVTQVYDYFLVLDIEGTCEAGTTFDYPNEIIVGNQRCYKTTLSISSIAGVASLSLGLERPGERFTRNRR